MFAIRAEHFVKPGRMGDWLKLAHANSAESLKEATCLRFDVLVSREDPNRALLYELYESREAWLAHCETPHFNTFVESVKDVIDQRLRGEFELQDPPGA